MRFGFCLLMLGCSTGELQHNLPQAVVRTAQNPSHQPPSAANYQIEEDFDFVTTELDLHQEINLYREDVALNDLELSAVASSLCRQHSEAMAAGEVDFGHDGFEDRAALLLAHFGATKIAENVASTYADDPVGQTVDTWLGSEGHRENIEGAFQITGVGSVEKEDGEVFFTQLFIAIESP